MIAGIDGHGWIGRDADGNFIYKSDADLERERQQREADKLRPEKLYIAEEFRVFFLTRQPNAAAGDGRNAYIAVRPFGALPPGAVEQMKTQAEAWDAAASKVRIEAHDPQLIFYDDITKTQSPVGIGELDAEVRNRLRGGKNADDAAWSKYFNTAAAPAAEDITVGKPMQFKRKTGFTL